MDTFADPTTNDEPKYETSAKLILFRTSLENSMRAQAPYLGRLEDHQEKIADESNVHGCNKH